MANSRMAGEKLDEPTKESTDAKQALSNSERNKQIREEIGNDTERLAERISGVDREKYDFDGYTDKEINMALQGESFGDKDYARLTGNPIEDKPEVGIPEEEQERTTMPVDPIQPPADDNKPPESSIPRIPEFNYGGGGLYQNVNQDNDINTNINGDNNTVTNNQNNSVGQYGASGRAKYLRDRYVADVSRFVRA